MLRDLEDAAQSYPDAIWPGQIARELRVLIHAANLARDQGLAAVPDDAIAGHLRLFRHGVNVGLSGVRRLPGANSKQPPALHLLECPKHREADVLRFLTDTAIPPTSNQAEGDLRTAKTPAEDLRPAPLGENHPRPVRHPRIHLHRRQAWTSDLHRHPRRPRRKPLDTAHPRHRMNCTRNPLHNAVYQ